ncbi:MAG TPA: hypothetical protein VK362_22985 [Reyranella sp.]|nr:hypothetical protein [Reyranella sp.]
MRAYSLNLIVNDAAWADPAKRAIAEKIVDAVQEGYNAVTFTEVDGALQGVIAVHVGLRLAAIVGAVLALMHRAEFAPNRP